MNEIPKGRFYTSHVEGPDRMLSIVDTNDGWVELTVLWRNTINPGSDWTHKTLRLTNDEVSALVKFENGRELVRNA